MPLPGSDRDKKLKFLQEIAIKKSSAPEFLQEINEPEHQEEKPKRKRKAKKA